MLQTKPNIFLLAGRTGGPLSPLISISNNLKEFKPIYIGVKNSYEERLASSENLEIYFLPEAKLALFTFKNTTFLDKAGLVLTSFWHLFLLFISVLKSFYLLLKFKPRAVLTAGSFLGVPVIFASKITNFLGLTKTKIVVHQQDPEPGISNKFAVKFADIKSCVFPYTKEKFPSFKNAQLIPNPIDYQKFTNTRQENLSLLKTTNEALFTFFSSVSTKPIFLIFGGGSGAKVINEWVENNLESLLRKFRIIHLTGVLQTEKSLNKIQSYSELNQETSSSLSKGDVQRTEGFGGTSKNSTFLRENSSNYFQSQSLFNEMPATMSLVDLVLCRSGLGSITELEFLQKSAFLVPIQNSHQELNAELIKDKFYILEQINTENWLKEINKIYPGWFEEVVYQSQIEVKTKLQVYFNSLEKLFDNAPEKKPN